jgi:hypothetical protein
MVRLLREAYHKKSTSGHASGLSGWQHCVIQWGGSGQAHSREQTALVF